MSALRSSINSLLVSTVVLAEPTALVFSERDPSEGSPSEPSVRERDHAVTSASSFASDHSHHAVTMVSNVIIHATA